MKIRRVTANNGRRGFEVVAATRKFFFPYAVSRPTPSARDRVVSVAVDREVGSEGFTYLLESGAQGTAHIDHVLEYNKAPRYLADMLLYRVDVGSAEGAREELVEHARADSAPRYVAGAVLSSLGSDELQEVRGTDACASVPARSRSGLRDQEAEDRMIEVSGRQESRHRG